MFNVARNDNIAVADTSTIICPERSTGRVVYVLTNTGATTITINLGQTAAVANSGIILLPNGSWMEDCGYGYPIWNGIITAIGSAAGGTLAVHERVRGD